MFEALVLWRWIYYKGLIPALGKYYTLIMKMNINWKALANTSNYEMEYFSIKNNA